MLDIHHLVAEAWPWRDLDCQVVPLDFEALGGQFVVSGDARLVLLLARGRRRGNPFQLPCKQLLPGCLLLFDLTEDLLFLLEPGGVVALEWDAAGILDFKDPLRDMVEEVSVVGDDDDRTYNTTIKSLAEIIMKEE